MLHLFANLTIERMNYNVEPSGMRAVQVQQTIAGTRPLWQLVIFRV